MNSFKYTSNSDRSFSDTAASVFLVVAGFAGTCAVFISALGCAFGA